ncbi:MAG: glycogen/starch synthase [Desulfobacteraceae bacterium]|nr:glycogen/starch synthase [Desulfobacteraceae bacterium]
MPETKENPRVLIVTPEVTYLPPGMGNIANYLSAKAGGLADVSAALISKLFALGADIHVAMPDYRGIFHKNIGGALWEIYKKEIETYRKYLPEERLHLAEDRAFYYVHHVYSDFIQENLKIALAFQREVINNIIPRVRPDMIHCNDWMTGLIPAYSRLMGIPSLFTIHNIHTVKATLAEIEDRGIDAAAFWHNLYYEHMAIDYEQSRDTNQVDLLVSGVFAAHFVNTVSPTFLREIVSGRHNFVSGALRGELANKVEADCAYGILNAPDPSCEPSSDPELFRNYTPEDHTEGKRANKLYLQKRLGLIQDGDAPVFFWPSRLDPVQKGCQLLADILYYMVSKYWNRNLQVIFVANGVFQKHFLSIVEFHGLEQRVAVCNFFEALSRLAYAASDFLLMPSGFEPCGLPQMIGPKYGTLPVAHDTGGIHDTVEHINAEEDRGNGFLFEVFDSRGLMWAVDRAMEFYTMPTGIKARNISRIMKQSAAGFNHEVTAGRYIELYEKMLQRPLITGSHAKQN